MLLILSIRRFPKSFTFFSIFGNFLNTSFCFEFCSCFTSEPNDLLRLRTCAYSIIHSCSWQVVVGMTCQCLIINCVSWMIALNALHLWNQDAKVSFLVLSVDFSQRMTMYSPSGASVCAKDNNWYLYEPVVISERFCMKHGFEIFRLL